VLYVYSGHDKHEVDELDPVLGLYVPAAQLVHDDAPTELLKEPGAQGMHADIPEPGWKVPFGQLLQETAPSSEAYEPASQIKQKEDPMLNWNVPAGHARHAVLDMLPLRGL
jgi:hypothetical protein